MSLPVSGCFCGKQGQTITLDLHYIWLCSCCTAANFSTLLIYNPLSSFRCTPWPSPERLHVACTDRKVKLVINVEAWLKPFLLILQWLKQLVFILTFKYFPYLYYKTYLLVYTRNKQAILFLILVHLMFSSYVFITKVNIYSTVNYLMCETNYCTQIYIHTFVKALT